MRILINSELPTDFWTTAHSDRSEEEIAKYWNVPLIMQQGFIEETYNDFYLRMSGYKDVIIESEAVYTSRIDEQRAQWLTHWPQGQRFDVCMLDGGAWDRPTFYGAFSTLSEAVTFAEELCND